MNINCICNFCCSFDTKERHYIEYYNIIYILSEIFFVLTLGFFLVIEDEFIDRYFILLFFIPSYINFTLTYIRNYLCISFIFNLLYILSKFVFLFYPESIHDKIKEQYQDDKSVISYAIILYLIFFIQVSNILIYYIRNILVSPIIKNENMMFNNGLYYTLKYKTTNNIV
jgi:hypothetical protein